MSEVEAGGGKARIAALGAKQNERENSSLFFAPSSSLLLLLLSRHKKNPIDSARK